VQSPRLARAAHLFSRLVSWGRGIAASAVFLTGIAVLSPPAQALGDSKDQGAIIALHIPWAVGGPRIERDGSRIQHPGEWPTVRVQALRLWDTRTAWLNVQPRPGVWDFTHLDAHVALANSKGVEHLTLVLWGTPQWAARDLNVQDAPWLGPGSAAPPRDVGDWQRYVKTVVTRYQGDIDAYQIGNEPNHSMFWRGNLQELTDLISVAAHIVKEVDPQATVVAPGVLVTDGADLQAAGALWRALAAANVPVDALAFHWYPRSSRTQNQMTSLLKRTRVLAHRSFAASVPLWMTEVNVSAQGRSAGSQSQMLAQVHNASTKVGLDYIGWYAWTDLGPFGMLDLRNPVMLEEAMRPRNLSVE